MISSRNPIHRLKEILQRQRDLAMELAPAYQAVELLDSEETITEVTIIEHHPKWAPLWRETRELETEKDRILLNLGLAWERCPLEI